MQSNHFMKHTVELCPSLHNLQRQTCNSRKCSSVRQRFQGCNIAEQKRFCSSEVLNRRSLLQTVGSYFPQDIFPFHPNPICCNKFNPQHFVIVRKKKEGWPKTLLEATSRVAKDNFAGVATTSSCGYVPTPNQVQLLLKTS